MKEDGIGSLDTVEVNGGVPSEDQCLVGAGDIHFLNNSGVEGKREEDPVALRYQVLWQPHDWWWAQGSGWDGWTRRWFHWFYLDFVQNSHGDGTGNDGERQDGKGGGQGQGYARLLWHCCCFLWSVPMVALLDCWSLSAVYL